MSGRCQYQIISRWPSWSRWRKVTAAPHRERYPFDPLTKELLFDDCHEALAAADAMSKANEGDFRVCPVLREHMERPSGGAA